MNGTDPGIYHTIQNHMSCVLINHWLDESLSHHAIQIVIRVILTNYTLFKVSNIHVNISTMTN